MLNLTVAVVQDIKFMDGTMDAHVTNTGQNEEALASQIFENFCAASTMGKILSLFREMCRILKLKPTVMPEFYTKLKVGVFCHTLY